MGKTAIKSHQVQRYLRNLILRGVWSAGRRVPSEEALCGPLGVSASTVGNALRRLADEGLLDRTQGTGTFVSDRAATGIVAILGMTESFSSPMGYYFHRLAEEATSRINGAGYRPVLAVGRGDTPGAFIRSTHLVDPPFSQQTLGVLSTVWLGAIEQRLAAMGLPYVIMTRSDRPAPIGHTVAVDCDAMVQMAVAQLRAAGHADFAMMVMGKRDPSAPGPVDPGKHAVLKANNIAMDDDRLIVPDYDPDCRTAYEAFKRWWSRPNRPRAIFFYEDALCDVASRAMLELGVRVPDDLAVITHANVGRTFPFPVALTCIEYDPAEVCQAGWAMLDRLVRNEPAEFSAMIAPHVRPGASLG